MGAIISDIKQIPGTTTIGRSLTRAADAPAVRSLLSLTGLATTTPSTLGTSLVQAADSSAARSLLGLGTLATQSANIADYATSAAVASSLAGLASVYQPLDSDLTAIAALSTTSFGRGLLALADAAALRGAAGLGTLATQNGTFSGTSSGTNTGDMLLGSTNGGLLSLAGQVLSAPTTATPTFGSVSVGFGSYNSLNITAGNSSAVFNWGVSGRAFVAISGQTDNIPLSARGRSGQTASLFRVEDSALSAAVDVTAAGRTLLGTTTDDGANRLQVAGPASFTTSGVADNITLNTTGSGIPGIGIRANNVVRGYWAAAIASGNYFSDALTGDMIFRSESNRILFGVGSSAASMVVSSTGVSVVGDVTANSGNIRLGNIGGSFPCLGFRGALGSSNYTIGTLAGSHTYWNTPTGSQHFFQVNQIDVAQIGTAGVTTSGTLAGAGLRITSASTPTSASASGVAGTIAWDASYLYICTATNTWRRIAHATW